MATLKNLVDETTNIKNELVECHTNLKNNLIEKGVECSDTDKMSSLIDKVLNIELGKKWASGNMVIPYSTSITKTSPYSIPCKLDFEPSLVFVCMQKCKYTYNSDLYGNDRVTLTNLHQSAVRSMPITLEYVSNSIVISILGGDSIKYFDQTETTTWYACE